MNQIGPVLHFTNACDQVLFSLSITRPLSASETRIVGDYCKEIFATLQPSHPDKTVWRELAEKAGA
jgi:hypothetical protein